ncbi:MAG: peptide ABC transporter substrate-binding protein [Cellvibrionales bacterium]|nr:peptide ABC transporter substrate-binding protein [Cellvibrionales bacterium]
MKKLIIASAMILSVGGTSAIAAPDGIFRQAHEYGYGDKSSLDPASRGRVMQITEKLMSRLIRPDMKGSPSPDLATSWSANDSATEWTLKLRSGVSFHDGSSFEAADVLYTLNRVLDPENKSPARSAIKMIEKMEALDSMTVKFTLSTPFADMPLQLMDYRLRIIPEGSGDSIATSGIGTGPFKLVSFDAAGVTKLEANMDYWEGSPGVAKMEVIGIGDGQARMQALLGGQIDFENTVTNQQKPMFASNNKFKLMEVPTGNWRGLVFRTDIAPFDDVRVRQAVRMAADREDLVQLIMGGAATVACDTPVKPDDQYHANIKCPQDIAGAKKLLAEAGYPNGIDVEVYVATLEPTWPILAEAYQQQAAKAGIRVTIKQVPSDGYWSDTWMQKTVSATRWNERPADSALHEIYLSTAKWNESYYKDAAFDALLGDARRELDFKKRKALYVKAQEHLYETAGTLIPYHVSKLYVMNDRVSGIDAVENHTIRWHKVTVK